MKCTVLSLLTFTVFLIGCAAYPTAPPTISEAAPGPSLSQVRGDIEAYTGTRVRWGGEILSVKNQAQSTWLEILEYPLDDSGRPELDNKSRGRFFTYFGEFLDPEVYQRGREITVVGAVQEGTTQRIGEHEYVYPVVDADESYLWHPRERYRRYPYRHTYHHGHRPFFRHGFHRHHLIPHHHHW